MGHQEKLREYLDKYKLDRRHFADLCKVHENSIYLIYGYGKIGPNLNRKIFLATNGELNFNVFYKGRLSYKNKLYEEDQSKSSMVCYKR